MAKIIVPRTKDQLHSVIRSALGLNVPRKAVCKGHSAPFNFICDLYFETVDDALIIANRNGGKTVNFAILEFMDSATKNECESAHLGSIMAQAERAYSYINSWGNKNSSEIEKSMKTCTTFKNGSKIEIIPGTMNGVNSPHPHKAGIDEFELLDWVIFQEAISMPKSSLGINSSLRLGTTRKFPNGNAQKMIDEAHSRGFTVYKWCIFEVMENCGCKGKCFKRCKEYTTHDRNGVKKTWEEVCDGKGKRCQGYFSFKDVIKKFLTLDYETFAAQWLCEKPEKELACYSEFSEDLHIIPGNIADYPLHRGWELGRGWDFGFDDPTAVGFYLFNRALEIAVQVDEYIMSGRLITEIADDVHRISRGILDIPTEQSYEVEDWGDISGNQTTGVDGNSYISKLMECGIPVNSQPLAFIDGIRNVKRLLKRNAITGNPRFFVFRKCEKTIEALSNAQWDRTKGESVHSKERYKHDKYSHTLDQMRYFISGAMAGCGEFNFW